MDNEQDTGKDINSEQGCDGKSRRQFTRNALVGSAVLLSLANRPAWGNTGGAPRECVSAAAYESYMDGNTTLGAFDSMHPGVADRIETMVANGSEPNEDTGALCPVPDENNANVPQG